MCIDHVFLVPSSADGHLGCFCVLAIRSRAAHLEVCARLKCGFKGELNRRHTDLRAPPPHRPLTLRCAPGDGQPGGHTSQTPTHCPEAGGDEVKTRGPLCVWNTALVQMASSAAALSDLVGRRTFPGCCFFLEDGRQRWPVREEVSSWTHSPT